jgi:phosphoglycolate phosphatase
LPTSPFDLYVFDLDGTLIDSRRDLADSVNTLLVESGAPALAEAEIGRMVGDGAATLVARALAASGIRDLSGAVARFLAIYEQHLTDHTRPYDGIPAVLTALGARATLALLTNKPLASTRTILDRLDLRTHFSDALTIGGDGPWPRKPDPAGLSELMRVAGCTPRRTILVGDSLIDWKTAHAAGTSICLVRYGFGFEGVLRNHSLSDDLVVDSPSGLFSL